MVSTVAVRSPYDGSLIGEVPESSTADVEDAVARANAALEASPLPLWQRVEILDAAVVALSAQAEFLERLIAMESAKPLKTARVEVDRAISTFRFAVAEARTARGDVVPLDAANVGDGKVGFTLRFPVGVVGAITPFNFPLNLVAHKVAPAIAAGCPVVLKPAEQTPLTALRLAAILTEECGLPTEYLTVLTGYGETVGAALVRHPGIEIITFTGSTSVGWAIKASAPRKRVCLELGGTAPVIIEPDGDWITAAQKVATAGYSYAGQTCVSVQRVYVHRSIIDEFLATLSARVEGLRVGDPLDESTDVSVLISPRETERVHGWIHEAIDAGASVATGGAVSRDGVLLPTVLGEVTPSMRVSRDEVFGPVVGVTPYDHLSDAIYAANDSPFGLQAGIFTSNMSTVFEAMYSLAFGSILVNEVPTWRADNQPYGGRGDSGNTKEGPAYAMEEMTETRLVVLSDR